MGCILDRIRNGKFDPNAKTSNPESRVRLQGQQGGQKRDATSHEQMINNIKVNKIRSGIQSQYKLTLNIELNDKINTRKQHISDYQQKNKQFQFQYQKLINRKGQISFKTEEQHTLMPYLINLKNLANAEDQLGFNQRALRNHRKYLALIEKMDYPQNGPEITVAEKDVAWIQFKRGHAQKAERNLADCLQRLGAQGQTSAHVEILSCQANIKLIQGQYDQSLKLYQRILQIQKKINSQNLIYANLLTKAGLVNYHLKNLDVAVQYYKQSLRIVEILQGKDSMQYGRILGNLGNTYVSQHKFSESRENYKECINICKKNNAILSTLCENSFVCIGNSYMREKRFKEAVDFFEQAKIIQKKLNSIQLVQTLNKIMLCYLQLKNMQSYSSTRIKYLQESLINLQNS